MVENCRSDAKQEGGGFREIRMRHWPHQCVRGHSKRDTRSYMQIFLQAYNLQHVARNVNCFFNIAWMLTIYRRSDRSRYLAEIFRAYAAIAFRNRSVYERASPGVFILQKIPEINDRAWQFRVFRLLRSTSCSHVRAESFVIFVSRKRRALDLP